MTSKRRLYIKFAIVLCLYLLWTLWVGSWWLLLFVPIIIDYYITKRVNWTFWKKKGVKRQSKAVEWFDALIFAVVVATLVRIFLFEAYTIPTSSMEKSMLVGDYLFVSKVAYGPKLPNTPVAMPFVHHTMPITGGKAYSEIIKWPYKRIAGISEIKRGDVMVFNFPAGDTIVVGLENPDYYSQVRSNAAYFMEQAVAEGQQLSREDAETAVKRLMAQQYTIATRPVDKRENYIKRGVGMPGDTLQLVEGVLYVNGKQSDIPEELQYMYTVRTNGTPINQLKLREIGLANDDMNYYSNESYQLPLTAEMVKKIERLPNVVTVERQIATGYDPSIFPFDTLYQWNVDNFGPLYVPAKGVTVALNKSTLPFYRRIIETYEGNKLRVNGEDIYVNGEKVDSYTFKMDYFWMMGDNRHMSADSRYWGFVPEDHVVGKASFIWLSLDKDEHFFKKIRWNRLFKKVR